jgi:hypothetical protein
MGAAKTDLITFKVEPSLAELINRMPNKSEFIRKAILGALESSCPLCQGTGVLTPEQQGHWKRFAEHHRVETCGECQAVYVQCDSSTTSEPAPAHA